MKEFLKIVLVLALIASGYVFGCQRGKKGVIEVFTTRVDTIVVRDTIRFIEPRFYEVRVVDTMLVAVRDTVVVNDTVFVKLERERKTYSDSSYYAVVSGFQPSLDTLEIYKENKTIYVHNTERAKPKRFGIGVGLQVGAGIDPVRRVGTVYTGVGISLNYNFVRF